MQPKRGKKSHILMKILPACVVKSPDRVVKFGNMESFACVHRLCCSIARMQRDLRDFVVTFLPAFCLAIACLLSIREVAFRV